jgi:hypothetical protein
MSKKKRANKMGKAEEPGTGYKRPFKIYSSFEEQNENELEEMARLKPEELLLQLRKFINIAYGMHGYNPNDLPKKHSIKIIKGER